MKEVKGNEEGKTIRRHPEELCVCVEESSKRLLCKLRAYSLTDSFTHLITHLFAYSLTPFTHSLTPSITLTHSLTQSINHSLENAPIQKLPTKTLRMTNAFTLKLPLSWPPLSVLPRPHVCMHICMSICMYVCKYLCMYVCMTFKYATHTFYSTNIHTYICTHIHTYIHRHTWSLSQSLLTRIQVPIHTHTCTYSYMYYICTFSIFVLNKWIAHDWQKSQ